MKSEGVGTREGGRDRERERERDSYDSSSPDSASIPRYAARGEEVPWELQWRADVFFKDMGQELRPTGAARATRRHAAAFKSEHRP